MSFVSLTVLLTLASATCPDPTCSGFGELAVSPENVTRCYCVSARFEADGSPSARSSDPCCTYSSHDLVGGLHYALGYTLGGVNLVLLAAVGVATWKLHKNHDLRANLRTLAYGTIAGWAIFTALYWLMNPFDTDKRFPPMLNRLLSLINDPFIIAVSAFADCVNAWMVLPARSALRAFKLIALCSCPQSYSLQVFFLKNLASSTLHRVIVSARLQYIVWFIVPVFAVLSVLSVRIRLVSALV